MSELKKRAEALAAPLGGFDNYAAHGAGYTIVIDCTDEGNELERLCDHLKDQGFEQTEEVKRDTINDLPRISRVFLKPYEDGLSAEKITVMEYGEPAEYLLIHQVTRYAMPRK